MDGGRVQEIEKEQHLSRKTWRGWFYTRQSKRVCKNDKVIKVWGVAKRSRTAMTEICPFKLATSRLMVNGGIGHGVKAELEYTEEWEIKRWTQGGVMSVDNSAF